MKTRLLIALMFICSISFGQNVTGNYVRSRTVYYTDTTYIPTGTEPEGTSYWDSSDSMVKTVLKNREIYEWGKLQGLINVANKEADSTGQTIFWDGDSSYFDVGFLGINSIEHLRDTLESHLGSINANTQAIKDTASQIRADISTNEKDSIYDANSAQWLLNGDTIPEITSTGLTSVEYDNLQSDLTGNTVNNTVTWDIDGSGIITSAISSSGTVAFTNPRVNKTVCVVLTISSGATLTWPASAKILAGSATLADGTFYVYMHCISSTLYTVSITQEGE